MVEQGTWKHVEPVKGTGRKTSGRDIVDVAAFRRLLKLVGKEVDDRIRAAEKRQQKKEVSNGVQDDHQQR
jgi:hypothetical protein